jgi:Alpha-kinase family
LYQLHISHAQEHQKCGGFKVASPAHVDSTLFLKNLPKGLHESLYAKQVFYRTQVAKSLPTSTSTITPYLGPSAVACIEMELKCILWAQALLQLSYDYIKTFDDDNGPPPPHLMNPPQFRFIHAALAVEQGKPSRDTRAFLLEEEIEEATEGKFRKYFNNTSLVPCQFSENTMANRLRADFLAFTQHLQFWKTGKLVLMADYQGMLVPLTLSNFSQLCFFL